MRFYVEESSTTPSAIQIVNQVKLAVMMGTIRNGETLPSVRDIEKQAGVSRSQAHKAYQILKRSGLIVPIRGKGTLVTTVADSPSAISAQCDQLTKTIIAKIRELNLSPTAFARYLSQRAQESERNAPGIVYVDFHKEIAAKTASQISKLWQIPVAAMALSELKDAKTKEIQGRRFLTSHVFHDYVRSLLPGNGSAAIPVMVHYSESTRRKLAKIGPNSSALLILMNHLPSIIQFIMEQIHKLLKAPGIRVSSISIQDIPNLQDLLTRSHQHDYYIVGPGVRAEVPPELRNHPSIVLLEPKLNPRSLEAARIRAGVVL